MWALTEAAKQNISIEKFCENHLIPNVLEFKDFEEFINTRKELLKDRLKKI